MNSRRRIMPSLNAMLTLETAGRLLSFSKAAIELHVSQAAVSKQIKVVEDDLGMKLFTRANKRIALTPAGKILSDSLSAAFDDVFQTISGLREVRDQNMIRLGAATGITQFWLLPRLQKMRADNPGLEVRVLAKDEPFDLRRDDLDLILRYGTPPFEDGDVVTTTPDRIFPVCCPGFLSNHDQALELSSLVTMPLIATDSEDSRWQNSWSEWLFNAGAGHLKPNLVLHCNHYTDSITAALAGQGIALGWEFVVRDMIESGQLVRLTDCTVRSRQYYNLLISQAARRSKLCLSTCALFSDMLNQHLEGFAAQ